MSPEPYTKDYDVIKGFKGETLKDLKENIDLYLKELMEVINAPIIDCEHCNGVGTILKKIDLNGSRD